MKKPVMVMQIHNGDTFLSINGEKEEKMISNLPGGCLGIFFAFESKKTARTWGGKDASLLEIEKKE